MLEEAQQLRKQGVDIAIAYFEPHARPETIAKTEGLEMIPRRVITYNGSQFQEMDVDAVLRRKPAVAVVDEFAHTNVPGCDRTKRWEDVHVLLDAGIDVLTTMNVQHLESLNDEVWKGTGVRVRETVPDWVVDEADEVVFVDLTPRALRNRLERGVVYKAEKAQQAMDNFFSEANLNALRELAMRHAAHELEEKLTPPPAAPAEQRPGDPQPADNRPVRERILICLTGRPTSAVLIRRGKRVADYLQAECLAIHVPGGAKCDEAAERHLTFARNLRIDTHVIQGDDPAGAITEFARANRITQIFVGRSRPLPWWQRFRETTVQRIVRHSRDMRVTIVAERRR
jgi:two-component system sensor histidine kinase KdpD